MKLRRKTIMAITRSDLNNALSAYLSCGPFADPDFLDWEGKQDRWARWRSQLTGDDIPLLVQEAVKCPGSTGVIDWSNPWLAGLLSCLRDVGDRHSEAYTACADRYRRTPHRAIFIATAGEMYSEKVWDWLIGLHPSARLSEAELRMVADACASTGCEAGTRGLDWFLESIPAEHVELHGYIAQLRLSRTVFAADGQ